MGTTRVFGLTGGIASGKSAAARRLRARGVPVVDADQLAREVLAPGTDGLAAVVEAFGEGVLGPSGELDRKALAAVAFSDPGRRAQLNAITHPRIGAATQREIARLTDAGEPLVCYEAALLVENGVSDMFRPLVVVAAPEATQVARAMARDGATEDEVLARVRAQMPLADKVARADVVIENDGDLASLEQKTDEALDRVLAATGADAARYPLP
jgi:dephospho-CoA kinase